jgi:chromosome segregation ATPase
VTRRRATEAVNLVNEQRDQRRAVAQARKEREGAVLSTLQAARQDILLYGRTGALDELVKTRQERVDSTRSLVERNILGKTVLSQVQSELSDAEQRRQDAINQYGMAKQRLATMEAEGLRIQSDLNHDLAVEIDAVERQIADNEREFKTSEGVLSSLPATQAAFATSKPANRVTYQIVRQTASGPVSIESSGMTLLQPGDLVNILVGAGDALEQPGSQSPTAPTAPAPGEAAPAERASKETHRTVAQD